MSLQQSPGKCLFIGGTLDGEWHTPARTTVKIPITQPVSVSVWPDPLVRYEYETYSRWIMRESDLGNVSLMVESQLSESTLRDALRLRGFMPDALFRAV